MNPPMIYRTLANESELRALWEFDHLSYGDAGLPWENLLAWWSAFPEGLHGAFAGDEIVGAVGMWPPSSAKYAGLVVGSVAEEDITAGDFLIRSSMRRHWYISGIVLREDWRRTGPIGALIFTAVEHLGSLANLERIDVCAIGSTKEGRRMLQRFGFQFRNTATPDGHPIYVSSDMMLDLALGEKSVPVSSPNFRYETSLRRSFSSGDPFSDLDDLRIGV